MKSKHLLATGIIFGLSVLSFSVSPNIFSAAEYSGPSSYPAASRPQSHSFGLISTATAAEMPTTGQFFFDFSRETVGAPPQSFIPAVGNWRIGSDQTNTVLVVDGSKWKRGVASAGLADKARALYGERYAEFLDNVTAYAYFPFAVATRVDNFSGGEISVRFKAMAGRIDQGAGILFDLQPNGDYYALRANPLEDNLVLWRYKHGRRSSVSWVRDVKTPSRKWHTLRLTVEGNLIKGYVNGRQYLTYRLPSPVTGKVGLWTKADSVVYFDDYQVEARKFTD